MDKYKLDIQMTERDEVLCILKHEVTGVNDRFGVKRMGLFGSVVRDEAKDTRDIDILTDLDPPGFISEISRP